MDTPRPLLVVIVNDFPVVVAGVAALLRPFADRVQVEQYVDTLPPAGLADVVLFDPFGRPGALDRLETISNLTGAPVLVYTWVASEEHIAAIMQRGAAGLMPKTLDGPQLMGAIEAVVSGVQFRTAPVQDKSPMGDWPGQAAGLSAREAEVVVLVTAGMGNQEIADSLFLSVNSIKTYIRSAYRKMGVSSRAQAVLWGVHHGLMPPAGHVGERGPGPT